MGKASKALKQVLDTYDISQSQLAVALGVGRSVVNNWVKEYATPTSDGVLEIRNTLRTINPEAAEEFIRLYLED
ncbi:MAG: helix-turn-helix transcriptional regulator [Nostocaceae cyanobacterium]|nr:helix-turn-helix transcriptional regulator [Nostocaceae cyanobacterium]